MQRVGCELGGVREALCELKAEEDVGELGLAIGLPRLVLVAQVNVIKMDFAKTVGI
jgi:hypothetical protein